MTRVWGREARGVRVWGVKTPRTPSEVARGLKSAKDAAKQLNARTYFERACA